MQATRAEADRVATALARSTAASRTSTAVAGVPLGSRVAAGGKSISSAGHSMSSLSLPLLGAATVSIKEAVDFQSAMTLINTQAGAGTQEVTKLSQAVLKLAPAVGTGPTELAEALFPIESVGLRGAKAMEVLKVATEGARVGHADLATTTDVLVGALKVADLAAHGLAATMGLLNATVGGGKLHMEDLTAALGTGVLPAAKGVGLGLRDVGAGLDVMVGLGITGDRRGDPAQDAVRPARYRL